MSERVARARAALAAQTPDNVPPTFNTDEFLANENGRYFYHGTRADLHPGDTILPANSLEPNAETNYDGVTNRNYAYAMTRPDHANDYAFASHQDGDQVVYCVESLGDHEPDPHEDSDGEYFRSPTGFRVLAAIRHPENWLDN